MSDPAWTEAAVTINGTQLSDAQSLALRVAVAAFFSDLDADLDTAGGEDSDKRRFVALYRARTAEIFHLMLANERT